MRRTVMLVVMALSVSPLLAACSEPAVDEVALDTEFTLAVGQTVEVDGEDLTIEFVEVVSDSRCPSGATCIWAGEASCLIEVTSDGSTFSKVLTQPGGGPPATDEFARYKVTFDLLPYPEADTLIKHEDYNLKMTVGRKPV